jgi:CheY-like chemotaxis protein
MKKILLAEDHEMTAEIMQMHLKKYRFETIIAPNGKEAVAILEKGVGVSAVVTDLMMPEMSGFELLAEMKGRFEWCEIPVIVTSARAEPETVMKAAELGCVQFMVKPVRGADLVKAITVALADRPLVLRAREEVMEQLGIDHEIYDRFVERLTGMLRTIVTKLDESLTVGTEPGSQPVLGEIGQLVEAATLLGAESLGRAVGQLVKRPPADGSGDQREAAMRRLLQREFQMLLAAIQTRTVAAQEQPATPRKREEAEAAPMRKRVIRASY